MPNDYEQLKMEVEKLKMEVASMQSASTVNPQVYKMILDIIGNLGLNNLSDVNISSPSSNQVLKYNGTVWYNGTDEVV